MASRCVPATTKRGGRRRSIPCATRRACLGVSRCETERNEDWQQEAHGPLPERLLHNSRTDPAAPAAPAVRVPPVIDASSLPSGASFCPPPIPRDDLRERENHCRDRIARSSGGAGGGWSGTQCGGRLILPLLSSSMSSGLSISRSSRGRGGVRMMIGSADGRAGGLGSGPAPLRPPARLTRRHSSSLALARPPGA